jgi:hypothetical protein
MIKQLKEALINKLLEKFLEVIVQDRGGWVQKNQIGNKT